MKRLCELITSKVLAQYGVRPSYRELQASFGLTHAYVKSILVGARIPSDDTIVKIGRSLRVSDHEIQQWLIAAGRDRSPSLSIQLWEGIYRRFCETTTFDDTPNATHSFSDTNTPVPIYSDAITGWDTSTNRPTGTLHIPSFPLYIDPSRRERTFGMCAPADDADLVIRKNDCLLFESVSQVSPEIFLGKLVLICNAQIGAWFLAEVISVTDKTIGLRPLGVKRDAEIDTFAISRIVIYACMIMIQRIDTPYPLGPLDNFLRKI